MSNVVPIAVPFGIQTSFKKLNVYVQCTKKRNLCYNKFIKQTYVRIKGVL
jgi:hypothetical protein